MLSSKETKAILQQQEQIEGLGPRDGPYSIGCSQLMRELLRDTVMLKLTSGGSPDTGMLSAIFPISIPATKLQCVVGYNTAGVAPCDSYPGATPVLIAPSFA